MESWQGRKDKAKKRSFSGHILVPLEPVWRPGPSLPRLRLLWTVCIRSRYDEDQALDVSTPLVQPVVGDSVALLRFQRN